MRLPIRDDAKAKMPGGRRQVGEMEQRPTTEGPERGALEDGARQDQPVTVPVDETARPELMPRDRGRVASRYE